MNTKVAFYKALLVDILNSYHDTAIGVLFSHNDCKRIADHLLANGVTFADGTGDVWISADQKPEKFVSVLGHMTDAGDFPAVRECYWTGEGFFFPALCERHPVDRWIEMPE